MGCFFSIWRNFVFAKNETRKRTHAHTIWERMSGFYKAGHFFLNRNVESHQCFWCARDIVFVIVIPFRCFTVSHRCNSPSFSHFHLPIHSFVGLTNTENVPFSQLYGGRSPPIPLPSQHQFFSRVMRAS